jgi:hypothetical protein
VEILIEIPIEFHSPLKLPVNQSTDVLEANQRSVFKRDTKLRNAQSSSQKYIRISPALCGRLTLTNTLFATLLLQQGTFPLWKH